MLGRLRRIVTLGGGSAPSLVARTFSDHLERITAVVCTSDTGSSSGTCRRLFGMPAPGDVRATLSAFATLSGGESWARVWEDRLQCPASRGFHGMAVGNLVIAALFQETGDFPSAIRRASALLDIRGRVLPVTGDPADLRAELADGTVVEGELEVRRPGKPAIRRLSWASPVPRSAPGVLEAIREADLILLGPGCLYTSLLPCLLVKGVAEAIRKSKGVRVYLCNTTTTPGQTDGFTVARHVQLVVDALRGRGVDAVLLQGKEVVAEAREAYQNLGAVPLVPTDQDLETIVDLGARPFPAAVIEDPQSHPRKLHKLDTIRHDPERLRAALERLLSDLDAARA